MSSLWSGYPSQPLIYRSIQAWQQLAASGSLRPDDQLYFRGVWQRAINIPELQSSFPVPKPNWGALIGLGGLAALAAIVAASSAEKTEGETDRGVRRSRQSGKKRVFVSFDFDNDKVLKDFVIGQAKNPDSPFEVVDTSLKEAAPMKTWEEKARAAIRRSDLVLVMVGRNTYRAPGVLKEVRVARAEGIPIAQMIGYRDGSYTAVEGAGRLYLWDWENLKKLLG